MIPRLDHLLEFKSALTISIDQDVMDIGGDLREQEAQKY